MAPVVKRQFPYLFTPSPFPFPSHSSYLYAVRTRYLTRYALRRGRVDRVTTCLHVHGSGARRAVEGAHAATHARFTNARSQPTLVVPICMLHKLVPQLRAQVRPHLPGEARARGAHKGTPVERCAPPGRGVALPEVESKLLESKDADAAARGVSDRLFGGLVGDDVEPETVNEGQRG